MYFESPFFLIIIAVGIVAVLLFYAWSQGRAITIIEDWAYENDFQLIECSRVWFSFDPFVIFAGRGRPVYRVAVRDQNGNFSSALVRTGGFWLGLLSNYCDVKWLDRSLLS